MDHDRMTAYARDVFTLLFEMRRNPLCVSVMATQYYRWYQLEEGNLIGIRNNSNSCLKAVCPQNFLPPVSLLL